MFDVKIIKVTDLDGKPKQERIWGNERYLMPNPPEIGKRMLLSYDEYYQKVRTTTEVVAIQESLFDNIKGYHTRNSIYELEFLK